jgi:hypothetical protein
MFNVMVVIAGASLMLRAESCASEVADELALPQGVLRPMVGTALRGGDFE